MVAEKESTKIIEESSDFPSFDDLVEDLNSWKSLLSTYTKSAKFQNTYKYVKQQYATSTVSIKIFRPQPSRLNLPLLPTASLVLPSSTRDLQRLQADPSEISQGGHRWTRSLPSTWSGNGSLLFRQIRC